MAVTAKSKGDVKKIRCDKEVELTEDLKKSADDLWLIICTFRKIKKNTRETAKRCFIAGVGETVFGKHKIGGGGFGRVHSRQLNL